MGEQITETTKKAITVRLSPEDHKRLLELTTSTGISINSFFKRTIHAVHDLASDEQSEPNLPLFFATFRVSMTQQPRDTRFRKKKAAK